MPLDRDSDMAGASPFLSAALKADGERNCPQQRGARVRWPQAAGDWTSFCHGGLAPVGERAALLFFVGQWLPTQMLGRPEHDRTLIQDQVCYNQILVTVKGSRGFGRMLGRMYCNQALSPLEREAERTTRVAYACSIKGLNRPTLNPGRRCSAFRTPWMPWSAACSFE